MSVVIRIVGLAGGERAPQGESMYVQSYTPDGNEGRGEVELTTYRSAAKQYADAAEAHQEWARVSRTHPTRSDGKPNRPLSAFTIEVVQALYPKGVSV